MMFDWCRRSFDWLRSTCWFSQSCSSLLFFSSLALPPIGKLTRGRDPLACVCVHLRGPGCLCLLGLLLAWVLRVAGLGAACCLAACRFGLGCCVPWVVLAACRFGAVWLRAAWRLGAACCFGAAVLSAAWVLPAASAVWVLLACWLLAAWVLLTHLPWSWPL